MAPFARLLLGCVVAMLAALAGGSVAAACSCEELTTAQHAEEADVVARVTVRSVGDAKGAGSNDPVVHTVVPTHVWKGDVTATLDVATAASGASCGLEGLREGADIILFATENDEALPGPPALSAHLCGGTATAEDELVAEVVAVLGAGTPLEVPSPEETQPCTCGDDSTAEHAAGADLVARVVVEHVNKPVPGTSGAQPATYTLRPVYVWKGDVVSQFKVTSDRDQRGCGLQGIVEGQDLVVFAQESGDGWTADRCGGTAPASERLVSELLETVGPGVAPETNPGSRPGAWVWPSVAAVAAVLLLGGIVVSWWVRPRTRD